MKCQSKKYNGENQIERLILVKQTIGIVMLNKGSSSFTSNNLLIPKQDQLIPAVVAEQSKVVIYEMKKGIMKYSKGEYKPLCC